MNKKADVIYILFWLIIIGCTILYMSINANAIGGAKGSHTGIVTAIEHRNNLVWDADLVYIKTSEESTQEDVYCVNNLELKKKLEQYSIIRKMITVYFKNDFFVFKMECNGGISIIYDVQEK